jgi:hypothetical protein
MAQQRKTTVKSIASHVSLVLAGVVLAAAMVLLSSSQLEYCGQPSVMQSNRTAASMCQSQAPTLAPPQKVVFVHIETDKPDVEIGWLEN